MRKGLPRRRWKQAATIVLLPDFLWDRLQRGIRSSIAWIISLFLPDGIKVSSERVSGISCRLVGI